MGTGKSQSAIAYMNAHPNDRFIYISPFQSEANRIATNCPELDFVEPLDRKPQYQYTKTGHTRHLLLEGRNIASTHQCFKFYTPDMLEMITKQGYTLIIDENVTTIDSFVYHPDDLEIAVRGGLLREDGDTYTVTDVEYAGVALAQMMRLFKSRNLFKHKVKGGREAVWFWSLPVDLLTAFKDVFILTYMFEGQDLHQHLTMNGLHYQKIGVRRTQEGGWEFAESDFYIPEYVGTLSQHIHICDHSKLNSIGDDESSLSMNWFKTRPDQVDKLANNISNYFRNLMSDFESDVRLWSTYKNEIAKLRQKGFYRSHLPFNHRASNEYRNRRVLVYAVNVYYNVETKRFLKHHGAEVNEDQYALSTMLQWIWRSAIRDGEDIYIYIPSSRMRRLLTEWIKDVEKQYKEYAERNIRKEER
ncbi:MAG: hypothetical protein E7337_15130 [Clostridiales bacterium]|nr:hypothetical protein [Clostridiales bacterium]